MKALLKASALLVSTVLATVHGWDEGEAICYTGYIMDQCEYICNMYYNFCLFLICNDVMYVTYPGPPLPYYVLFI